MPANDRLYDETAPRSIFATTWFRALLVLIVAQRALQMALPGPSVRESEVVSKHGNAFR